MKSHLDEAYEIAHAIIVRIAYFKEMLMTTMTTNKVRSKETLYLLSIAGMKESILKGLKTPVKECAKKLKW